MQSNHDFTYLDELFIELQIIAAIKKDDKLFASVNKLTIHHDSWFTKLKRTVLDLLVGEKREDTLQRLETLLIRVKREADEFITGRRCSAEMFGKLQTHIQDACDGLQNLTETYAKDVKCKARLGIIHDHFVQVVEQMNQFLQTQKMKKQV